MMFISATCSLYYNTSQGSSFLPLAPRRQRSFSHTGEGPGGDVKNIIHICCSSFSVWHSNRAYFKKLNLLYFMPTHALVQKWNCLCVAI